MQHLMIAVYRAHVLVTRVWLELQISKYLCRVMAGDNGTKTCPRSAENRVRNAVPYGSSYEHHGKYQEQITACLRAGLRGEGRLFGAC